MTVEHESGLARHTFPYDWGFGGMRGVLEVFPFIIFFKLIIRVVEHLRFGYSGFAVILIGFTKLLFCKTLKLPG